jgi:hypothetical protein
VLRWDSLKLVWLRWIDVVTLGLVGYLLDRRCWNGGLVPVGLNAWLGHMGPGLLLGSLGYHWVGVSVGEGVVSVCSCKRHTCGCQLVCVGFVTCTDAQLPNGCAGTCFVLFCAFLLLWRMALAMMVGAFVWREAAYHDLYTQPAQGA